MMMLSIRRNREKEFDSMKAKAA